VLLLLVPVLIVNQEMVVRLGAVTGVGHARPINERFGRFWGWFSVGDLFLLNFLTITTEFIAIVGTTMAPWHLFFQQANVVDKRITPRFIGYERADTFLGSLVTVTGAGALVIVGAYAVGGTALAGHFTDALGLAHALEAKGSALGVLFIIVLLDASIIGPPGSC
jgi:Mn2+/Fe2+ NRAMP family transporter